ncbi:MAG: MATE family efflux transporter [Alphaproteobacteria bacterium]|jgi:putative MATE family efflux protein|nr:MATE family efflux transporter [Alphaproteobacteria bacterium]
MSKAINFTEGNIKSQLIKFAIPAMTAMLMIMTFQFVDTYFISMLGKKALIAMGFIGPIVMSVLNLLFGFGMAALNLSSKYVGQKKIEETKIVSSQILMIAIVFGILISILGLIFCKDIFLQTGADQESMPMILKYMHIWFLAVPCVIYTIVGEKLFFAKGDSKTPRNSLVLSFLTNTILDPIFIFGFFIIPATGIFGASLATSLSRVVAVVYMTAKMLKGNMLCLDKRVFKNFKPLLNNVLKISATSSFYYILIGFFPVVLNKTISSISLDAIAGIGAATKIEGFFIIITIASAIALSTFVGQNIGVKNYSRIKKALNYVSNFGIIYSLACSATFYLIGGSLVSIFTDNPEIIQYGKNYLLITSFSYMSHILIMEGHALWSLMGKLKYSVISALIQFISISSSIYLGAYLFGINGAIIGLSLSKFLVGLHSYFKMKSTLKKLLVK